MKDNHEKVSSAERLNAELLAMVRIASTILQHTELDDILSAITRELAQLIQFDRSSIALIDPDRQVLVMHHIYNGAGQKDPVGEGRRIPLDESSAVGWVALNRRAMLRRDIGTDGRFREVITESNPRSDLIVPLVAHGNVIGTLNAASFQADAFDDTDLEKLANCGNIASAAIEHAQLLEQAKDLGERYRTLQINASDVIMLIDRSSGRLLEVNRQCCEVLGQQETALLQKSYFDLFPPEDQFQARRDFINVMSQKSRVFTDRRLLGRNGSILFVDISASLIEIKSETFIQVLVHDITQRKMLEQQIILQNHNLQEANQKLREVDRMKTEFLANISHELRTPLSVIIAYTEALRDGIVGDTDRKHFLNVIAGNGENLLRLINDLLDLSKLEITGTMLSFTLSHIHDVVRSLWPAVDEAAREKGITVAFRPGYDIPIVYIDNRRVGQVVMCLVQNAIKFTDAGGSVEVTTLRSEEGVIVRVTDTGAGIPEEQVPRIFDTFRQLDGSATRRWGGLGIGLAIAKHIVELHGGTIQVESTRGKGSVFTVTIPIGAEAYLHTDAPPLAVQEGGESNARAWDGSDLADAPESA